MSWKDIKYFSEHEFDSPDAIGSGAEMDLQFVRLLDQLRQIIGTPIYINSGYRTEQHNMEVGGVPFSAHTKGLAADIRIVGNEQRYWVISKALELGFTRIGVAKTFVHLDLDTSLPSPRIWMY
jgi:uncharacterized protein YcbK (DUF882 family)